MYSALDDSVAFEADDIALVYWAWRSIGGTVQSAEGVTPGTLRRQADGSWKFTIDNADGPALIGLM